MRARELCYDSNRHSVMCVHHVHCTPFVPSHDVLYASIYRICLDMHTYGTSMYVTETRANVLAELHYSNISVFRNTHSHTHTRLRLVLLHALYLWAHFSHLRSVGRFFFFFFLCSSLCCSSCWLNESFTQLTNQRCLLAIRMHLSNNVVSKSSLDISTQCMYSMWGCCSMVF